MRITSLFPDKYNSLEQIAENSGKRRVSKTALAAGALASLAAGLLPASAYSQTRLPNGDIQLPNPAKDRGLYIGTADFQVGHEQFLQIKDGQTIVVPYETDFFIKPESYMLGNGTARHPATTYLMIERQDPRTQNWEFVKNGLNAPVITTDRINPEDYGVREDETFRIYMVLENVDAIRFNVWNKPKAKNYATAPHVIAPPTPTPAPIPAPAQPAPQAPAPSTPAAPNPVVPRLVEEEHTPSKFFLKAGIEYIDAYRVVVTTVDPQGRARGFLANGTIANKKGQLSVNFRSLTDRASNVTARGSIASAATKEANIIGDYSFRPLVIEGEFIKAKSGIAITGVNYTPSNNGLPEAQTTAFFVGAGIKAGSYDKSFIQAIFGGENVVQENGVSTIQYGTLVSSSRNFTGKTIKANGRVMINKTMLEGFFNKTNFGNKSKSLDGKSHSYGGRIYIPLNGLKKNAQSDDPSIFFTIGASMGDYREKGAAAQTAQYSQRLINFGIAITK